ncbi:MAG: PolC-type DNA polymerase III [Bacilli bacterium]|nr:PolC-type DNA polymerase III [Bacilli bacterium]
MNEKMTRFLTSINLNPSDFDLEFDALYRDSFAKNMWVMMIAKSTPWTYPSLRTFLDALKNINYPYKMSFSYRTHPRFKDIEALFLDWHLDVHHFPFKGKLKLDENILTFTYLNKEERDRNLPIVNDFMDLLTFFSYGLKAETLPNEITGRVKSLEETINEKHHELDESDKASQDEEHAAKVKAAENLYLDELEHNLKLMHEERDKKRMFKRGDYEVYEDFFKIPKDKKTNVDIDGEVYEAAIRTTKMGKKMLVGGIGNKISAISFRAMENKTTCQIEKMQLIDKNCNVVKGKRTFTKVRIRGCAAMDERSHEMSVMVHYLDILPDEIKRSDDAKEKRVELHLHTNMSQMDGVAGVEDYIKLAKAMGHKAIAVTDHGVVQAFPYAQKAAKNDIKVLYGCEMYLVDRKLNYIFNDSDVPLRGATYVCLDLETTGLSARYDRVIEFGAVKVQNDLPLGQMDLLINPECPLSESTKNLTHIDETMVKGQPTFKELWPKIKDFIGDAIIVTHNTAFDISFLNGELERMGLPPIQNPVIDTLSLSRYLFPDAKAHNLGALSRRLELDIYDDDKAHRADFDAKVLSDVWSSLLTKFIEKNPKMLHRDLGEFMTTNDMFKHMRPSHCVVLAKNAQGLKDLFNLVTKSHLEYLAEVPKIPRDEISKVRQNLIIGSACFNGEVFEHAHTRLKNILLKTMKFYDYIEIQPLSCYYPLIYKYKYSRIEYSNDENGPRAYRYASPMPELKNEEEIKRTIKDIMDAADELGLPVCATGDVHYLNPEDKVFREVYIATDGINHRAHPLCTNPRGYVKNHDYHPAGEQYFHSTDEMLEEFKYLGEAKAKEIVITNPNKIAAMCEVVKPVKDRLYTPHIDNADNQLRELAYSKAKELYGDPLPKMISERLELELSRIIGDKESYAVNYLLAREIVKKANDDGYFVGSRGSVGSSFIATLLGVTEVNPLPPHYYCSHCKKIIWNEDPKYISGIDLPAKKCPDCGHELARDGQNIPFETFLGFDEKSTKIPDIDLNFASVYQSRAHDYLRERFGRDHVFRAGTIGTYKDKMAFGCVKDYFIRSMHKDLSEVSKAYQSYLASKCTGVKKTTGQHPGGIILIPKEFNVHDFTPIQHPADDIDANWETTHFEFSTIHDTVLKLDLLGHKDPLALKMMGELTGVDFTKIPLGDQRVLSLFTSPDELHLSDNYLKFKTGTMGVPEFGTPFVQEVLQTAKPHTFNDLLVVSGITHGTDVWLNNAETLLQNKTAKSLEDIIGCRDDIMIYLMRHGVPNDIAFKVMEDVRKGRGVKQEYLEVMKMNDVPDFYIDSCQKIKYLFPRAHATAYVTQAVRVGYFKIYHPLAFYAVYFSTRSAQYDIDAMVKGKEGIIARLNELSNKRETEKLSTKEEDIIDTLKMALEMAERGYRFVHIDVNKSKASEFVIDEEHQALIPPFIVLDGLGDAAAEGIVKAREKKGFTSIEDFADRSPVSKKHLERLKAMGAFGEMRENEQLSLFDFSY